MATRLSPVRRARAARVLRAGGSWQAAADAAKCDKRTIGRLLKQPDFLNLTQGRGILQAGPLRIVADDSATLDDTDATESVVWIATTPEPEVLGSLVVADATHCRAVFVTPKQADAVRRELEERRFPLVPDAKQATLVQSALTALTGADELVTVTRLFTADTRESFAQ